MNDNRVLDVLGLVQQEKVSEGRAYGERKGHDLELAGGEMPGQSDGELDDEPHSLPKSYSFTKRSPLFRSDMSSSSKSGNLSMIPN